VSTNHHRAHDYLNSLLSTRSLDELRLQLEPKLQNPSPKLPGGSRLTMETLERHWQTLNARPESREVLAESQTRDLYVSVTLPNLIIGTIVGGACLPSQQACLDIMGLAGPGKARALAEVCAGLCLAGKLSVIGALCAGDFARAHRCLARGKTSHNNREETAHG